ncbi:MAG: DUF4430 domain-containing protein [Candidatus Hermodarchaeota archaeon]
MEKKKIFFYFIIIIVIISGIFIFSLRNTTDNNNNKSLNERSNVKSNSEIVIPEGYSQNFDVNGTYVYNVSKFEGPLSWWSFAGNRGFLNSSQGYQILVNFTDFDDKHPADSSSFSSPIPYLNITFVNNRTLYSISNTEAADAMGIGFNSFDSGFLIPINDLTTIKEMASAASFGLISNGQVSIEETYNFIYFSYEQDDGNQKTYTIYDKSSGLLVWANTTVFGFEMEIQSLNFTFNYDLTYNYTVNEFAGPLWWWSFAGNRGFVNSSKGYDVLVNFTGYYDKHPFDGSCFPSPIPYINITFVNNRTLYNISNTEAADALILGFNGFDAGFLLAMENLTEIKLKAQSETSSAWNNGYVEFNESALTLKITYIQTDGDQNTFLIYDKITGLLLWGHTEAFGYVFELTIKGYIQGTFTIHLYKPPIDSDDDEDKKRIVKNEISPDSIQLFASILAIIVGITTALSIYSYKVQNVKPKFILIGIIGVFSFTGLITYSYGLIPLPEKIITEENVEVEDITLIIDYGDGTITKWEDITVDKGDTVFDLLQEYCDVEYEDYGDQGVLVTSIDGYENGDESWYYGVNGEKIGYSCSKYEVEEGDIINWIYGDDYSPQ